MQHKLRRFISVLLLVVTLLNGIALTNQKAYAVTPQQVNDAVDKFIGAVGKFGAKDATKNIGKIANFCSRLGGLTSAASGVIGILQMMGVIKDPTTQMLGQILDAVKDVQNTLNNMNETLNRIAQDLLSLHVDEKWDARNAKATTMSTNWNRFNTDYTEKLDSRISTYEAKINSGIKAWWEQASHEGVYVFMTKKYTEEDSLTYSRKKYSEGLPAKSDIKYSKVSRDVTIVEEPAYWHNPFEFDHSRMMQVEKIREEIINVEEEVSADWSIGIPAECMPNTSAVSFNIDTYRDDFKKIMVTALDNAIKDNKLASNCGASVKSEYSGSSKQAMLESYADNVLNTVMYKIACEVMTANNSWVAEVISLYKQYCDNILKQDSGVNAFLDYIYFTHAFEGEVKEDIERFLDGMTAMAGLYGQFALTCAGQDSLQTTATKEQIQEYFTNTVISLNDRKAKAITGENNYCYITGTILKADKVAISSGIHVGLKNAEGEYSGCDVKPWDVKVPSIADSVYVLLIYKQYTKLPQGTKSFGEYLNKYGVHPDTNNKLYMTRCNGMQTFDLSDGIYMMSQRVSRNGNYFSHDEWYRIDVGTGSKVERQYYHCHDKVVGDLFDSSNGGQAINTIIAARAFYGEHHGIWAGRDEGWGFASEGVSKGSPEVYHDDRYFWVSRTVDILKSEACHDLNGDEVNNPENPFFAFDMASIIPGVSDVMDPHYETTSKDITEILLDSDSFAYTGQPVEPAVTVFASEDVVPEDGYTVTYINNIESGDSAVIRVEGVGDYAGVITRHFTITANDESDSPATSPTRHHSSGGCNAMSGMGVVLGLAFVIRKFRRK